MKLFLIIHTGLRFEAHPHYPLCPPKSVREIDSSLHSILPCESWRAKRMATSSGTSLRAPALPLLLLLLITARGAAGFSISSCVPTRTVLCAAAASSSSSSSADGGGKSDGGKSDDGNSSGSAGGGSVSEGQQAAEPSTGAASEYRPLQRQWWEVRHTPPDLPV